MPGKDDKVPNIVDAFKQLGVDLGKTFGTNVDFENIIKKVVEVEKGALNVAKAFGVGREQVVALRASLADAVTSVTLLGGSFDKIVEIQKDIGETIGRNIILNSEYYDDVFAMSEVTGVNVKAITKGFKEAGFSVYSTAAQMQKVVDTARSIGVNTKLVSDLVVANLSKMDAYGFEKGVQGLAKMAAQATVLKIDMTRTFTLAEDMLTPEKAIEKAAALQRLGVTQSELLDPLRLMDLSMNDVEELQNQIVDMAKSFAEFNEETGRFEIPKGVRLQLREIGSTLGFDYDQITKLALGAKDLDMKMSRIQFPETSEENKELIANLAEFDPGRNEYVIKYQGASGETITKTVSELQKEDIELLAEKSKPIEMIDLAKQQLDSSNQIIKILTSIESRTGYALGGTAAAEKSQQTMVDLFEILEKTVGGEKLSIEGMREGLDSGIANLFSSLKSGDVIGGVSTSLESLGTYLKDAFMGAVGDATKAVGDFKMSLDPFAQEVFKNYEKTKIVPEEKENVVKEAEDFILQTHPQDKLKIIGGTDLYGEKSGSSLVENKINGDINLKITVDAPPNVDSERLKAAFEDNAVMQKIVEMFIKTVNNNGVTGSISPTEMRARISGMANRGL